MESSHCLSNPIKDGKIQKLNKNDDDDDDDDDDDYDDDENDDDNDENLWGSIMSHFAITWCLSHILEGC